MWNFFPYQTLPLPLSHPRLLCHDTYSRCRTHRFSHLIINVYCFSCSFFFIKSILPMFLTFMQFHYLLPSNHLHQCCGLFMYAGHDLLHMCCLQKFHAIAELRSPEPYVCRSPFILRYFASGISQLMHGLPKPVREITQDTKKERKKAGERFQK
jgi:hypothetical protein